MVTVTFCGYLESSNPEFMLNIASNSSKMAGQFGDLNFHMNTLATKKHPSKGQDAVFSMIALDLAQEVFPDKLCQVFNDPSFGASLLKKGNTPLVFNVHDQFIDCPVFLHGKTLLWKPGEEVQL